MTEKEEEYLYFVSSLDVLNNAWLILQEIKKCKGSSLLGSAFQFALIEYSKPYKVSIGTVLNSKGKPTSYKLDESYIPDEYIELHKRILDARDQFHAHSDLTVREARLWVKNSPNGKISGTTQNKIVGTEELSNIDKIIDLIEKTLTSMYDQAKLLEQELLLSS
jgi:hypothetical protein